MVWIRISQRFWRVLGKDLDRVWVGFRQGIRQGLGLGLRQGFQDRIWVMVWVKVDKVWSRVGQSLGKV